jgi:CelD/BcsL family acetyltransferase involved in cellulose biosynthesis
MFAETLWLGPMGLRIAKLLGGDFSIQLCNPPVREGWATLVLRAASRYLTSVGGCDAVIFSPLSAYFGGFDEFRAACYQLAPELQLAQDQKIDRHSIFSLPQSFEAFLKGLGKNQRHNCRRNLNLLDRSFKVMVDSVSEPVRLQQEFIAFSKMHTSQWNTLGQQGHFRDWPFSLEFNLELVNAHAELCRVRLYRLLLSGEPVAYQYCFVFNGGLYWRLAARVVGRDWGRYALGMMGFVKLIESAIGEGVGFIEGSQGHYDYKTQMGATEPAVHSLVTVSKRRSAMGRFRLMKMLSVGLNIAYNKILYRRIYPRVPLLRRPLMAMWIRSRF